MKPQQTDRAAFFDTTRVLDAQPPLYPAMSPLRQLLLEGVKTLHMLQEIAAIRERLFSMIFEGTTAGIAAIVIDDSLWAETKVKSGQPIAVARNVIDRVLTEGGPLMARDAASTVICVALEGYGRRIGVLYAEATGSDSPLSTIHVAILEGLASTAAMAFEAAWAFAALRAENIRLKQERDAAHDLIGSAPALVELINTIKKVAPTMSTILIQGETGTGKELVARAIHNNSNREQGPFVSINCAAIPENLMESELFGYERGAFTGALDQKLGQIELANGGTLFLDEVGELSLTVQAKLLRVLQQREVQRLGGKRPIPVDVRIVAATNRDLAAAASKNEFRQDLFYRLNVVALKTPPLRERRTDIPVLARHFVHKFAQKIARPLRGVSREAEQMLLAYDWPGNVRELENMIERAVAMGSTDVIMPEDLPSEMFESGDESGSGFHALVNAAKRSIVEKAFTRAGGDPKKAASILILNLNYLYRLLNNLNLKHLLG